MTTEVLSDKKLKFFGLLAASLQKLANFTVFRENELGLFMNSILVENFPLMKSFVGGILSNKTMSGIFDDIRWP